MADHTNYNSNPAEYLLELIEEGSQSYESICRAFIASVSNDAMRAMMHANEIWPNRCQCGEDIADGESDCDECKEATEIEEFIDENCDDDDHDIDALRTDIENDNFDIVIDYDQVDERYSYVELIQKSLTTGQYKQARELCDNNNIEYRDALIEQLDRKDYDYDLFELPSWALSAIVNGDFSGIDDNQADVDMVNKFMNDHSEYTLGQLDDQAEGYFSNSPEFGLATTVIEYVGVIIK